MPFQSDSGGINQLPLQYCIAAFRHRNVAIATLCTALRSQKWPDCEHVAMLRNILGTCCQRLARNMKKDGTLATLQQHRDAGKAGLAYVFMYSLSINIRYTASRTHRVHMNVAKTMRANALSKMSKWRRARPADETAHFSNNVTYVVLSYAYKTNGIPLPGRRGLPPPRRRMFCT